MEKDKTPLYITGGNGLVGSRIIELLSDYDFFQINRTNGFDITDPSSLQKVPASSASVLIHMAAKTDVDGCESEKALGHDSEAWKINVQGTQNVADFCKTRNLKMILISTDFVFDGQKPEGEFYTEVDIPNPINYYAQTKYEAELVLEHSQIPYIVVRIAYPYRVVFEQKKDFVRAILGRLQTGKEIKAITDHIICPTFIDDIAPVFKHLIEDENASGIYHAVGSTPLSPYDAAEKMVAMFHIDPNLIGKTTREEYFAGKAKRPFNLYLKNDRIENLGIKMKTFEEGLREFTK